jgi:DNA-directed RNA polymerase specialized sigma24 family protein
MVIGDCEGGVQKAEETAVELYQLAALMLGDEGEAASLVESTVADVDVDPCTPEDSAVDSARHHLVEAAVARMNQADPGAFVAPTPAGGPSTCIEDDDLAAAGFSAEQIAELLNGPGDGRQLRDWLDQLPAAQRAIFVQRAVLGWNNDATAESLANGSGAKSGWSAAQVSDTFRLALCSLANSLVHAEAQKVTA